MKLKYELVKEKVYTKVGEGIPQVTVTKNSIPHPIHSFWHIVEHRTIEVMTRWIIDEDIGVMNPWGISQRERWVSPKHGHSQYPCRCRYSFSLRIQYCPDKFPSDIPLWQDNVTKLGLRDYQYQGN